MKTFEIRGLILPLCSCFPHSHCLKCWWGSLLSLPISTCHCISYLSLSNRLPQNVKLSNNNKPFTSFSFCGSGTCEQLSRVALTQSLSWGRHQDVAQGCVIWRLNWGWRSCFQCGSLICLLGRRPQVLIRGWQVTSAPHHVGPSVGWLQCSYDVTAGVFQSEWRESKGAEESMVPFMFKSL